MNDQTKPIIYRLTHEKDERLFKELINQNKSINIYDTIDEQLLELYKVRFPDVASIDDSSYQTFLKKELKDLDKAKYGVWVYYPWSNRLVHVLDEEEFFDVRTNRNNNKITFSEQKLLKNRVVGIIGLSVGQSVALTIAMERICGKVKLADFDTIELSNLNRIRTSVHNLGLLKVVAVAREIAEIDPFIEVEVFREGLNEDNMSEFLGSGEKKIDILLELCDGLDIKILSRVAARKLAIPVIMETNDRCMLDIERFDLEPNREILHGLVSETDILGFSQFTAAERMNLVLKIVGSERLSARMKEAFAEMGKTMRSWPQLASSVTMGAGVTTDIVRRILLNQKCDSGRWYFDVDDFLSVDGITFVN